MFPKLAQTLKKIDWILFVVVFLLVAVGLVIQYSLVLNSESGDFSQFYKQLFAFAAGLFLFFIFSCFDYRWFSNFSALLYFFSALLLLGVLFFGQNIRGTQGWYVFGPINFQPVELVKIFLIIFLAAFFSSRLKKNIKLNLLDLASSGFFVFILFTLVILQPDLGSALLLFGVWLIFFLVVSKKRFLFLTAALAIVGFIFLVWSFFLQDYQKDRLLTFINPGRDPLGVGYQVNQSIIAVGSGKFFGRGLGLGPQSQLHFLPDAGTDFIFSVIAEEFGLFGVSIIFILFGLLFWRLFVYTKLAYTDFSLLLIIGFLGLIFLQVFINIGMNIGLLPVTGIPLPFVSYGNSSLIAFFIALGILDSIKIHRVKSRNI